jgi:FkbM family methyltransferase
MKISSIVKKNLKKLLKNRGYEIFRQHYYDFNPDDSIRKILINANVELSTATVLDVGANVGQSVDRFRKYLPNAFIYSFEPNPSTFEKLMKKQTNDAKLKCFNFGLGAEKGVLPFFLNPDSGSNSFNKLNLNGDAFKLSNTEEAKKNHNVTTPKQEISYNTEVQIPVDTLNNVCAIEGLDRIDILKIDTQGFELDVLKGATEILPRTLLVEAEVMFSDAYENASSLGEIDNLMRKFGFVLWEIPYIGKFATEDINRINFIDTHFVNLPLLKKLN